MSQLSKGIPSSGPGSGTVTSISAGEGITLTPNPIVATGTVALTIPVSIADGGTNATSMTTTDGTIYFDGTRLVTTTTGNSTWVLTSNGPGIAPTYQVLPPSGTAWSVIAADQTAVVFHGYFCNKAGTLHLALPAVSNVGDVVEVSNENTALGIQITQIVGQQILIGPQSTTSGVTGTLTSSAVGDTLKLVCMTPNFIWRVSSLVGNWTPA